MLPLDKFKNKVGNNFVEDTNEEENLIPLFVSVGPDAKTYIKRIYNDGGEQVLNEILREEPEPEYNLPVPDDTYYNKMEVSDYVIFWSKSGVEPLVAVFKINGYGDSSMEEERVKNIDREAVENASYFILRGFDENKVNSVIDNACNKCFETEEAIQMVRSTIKEDPRLSAYALDEDEEGMFNEYRHKLRKNFLGGKNKDILDPKLYELDMGMGTNPGAETGIDSETQTKIAELQAEMAEKQAAHAKEMESLQQELNDLQGNEGGLLEKTDPNKGSQLAGFRHEGGPEALSNAISQMEWSGPGSQFDIFLNEITVDGYNMLGNQATSQVSEPGQQTELQPDAQDLEEPISSEPEELNPEEPDLSSL